VRSAAVFRNDYIKNNSDRLLAKLALESIRNPDVLHRLSLIEGESLMIDDAKKSLVFSYHAHFTAGTFLDGIHTVFKIIHLRLQG